MCHDDTDLIRVLDHESDYVEGILNYNWWVKLDAKEVCPVDVYMQDEYWNLHHVSSKETLAYQQHGYGVTVARHYAQRGQPLEHPTLPPIEFKFENQKQVRYLPLEKLYLHPVQAEHIYDDLGDLLGMTFGRGGRIISKRTAERAWAAHNREFILWGPGSQRCGEIRNETLGGKCSIYNQPELIRWD
ncbi:hypothetical protein AAVH_19633 [Aphelenchoides avenae]|nr:hypothetical protein AAVH_19633 [Aphelenchus avenae]